MQKAHHRQTVDQDMSGRERKKEQEQASGVTIVSNFPFKWQTLDDFDIDRRNGQFNGMKVCDSQPIDAKKRINTSNCSVCTTHSVECTRTKKMK